MSISDNFKNSVFLPAVCCFIHMQLSSLKYEKLLKHYTSQPNHQYNKQTVGVTFHQIQAALVSCLFVVHLYA